jgi:hypothetical protein
MERAEECICYELARENAGDFKSLLTHFCDWS